MTDASILEQVRLDATAAADERWRAHIAQLELLTHEGDYDRGWTDAWSYRPSRLRWWLFGLACGALIMGGMGLRLSQKSSAMSAGLRSEERLVGKECVNKCRNRW